MFDRYSAGQRSPDLWMSATTGRTATQLWTIRAKCAGKDVLEKATPEKTTRKTARTAVARRADDAGRSTCPAAAAPPGT
jgi:hypothetical protein